MCNEEALDRFNEIANDWGEVRPSIQLRRFERDETDHQFIARVGGLLKRFAAPIVQHAINETLLAMEGTIADERRNPPKQPKSKGLRAAGTWLGTTAVRKCERACMDRVTGPSSVDTGGARTTSKTAPVSSMDTVMAGINGLQLGGER